ncbi:MAG TPA: DUF998 domain-containing protein [Mycobacteriales bacterium]|nr:DUF998 domain-containing protein [Mycobacteriales bacterium]
MNRARVGAWCGIGAPVSFVGGWLLAGARADSYSPVHDHISELAQVGAPTRPLMTAALVGFGVLAPVWAGTLGRSLAAPEVRAAVTAAGVTTLGVAALPLGGDAGDGAHAVAAGLGYAAMALSPLLAARHLEGRTRTVALVVGAASATLLSGTLLGHASGALQRAGLGVVDAWFLAMAVRELRR